MIITKISAKPMTGRLSMGNVSVGEGTAGMRVAAGGRAAVMPRRHGIDAARMPGMATGQAPQRQPRAASKAMRAETSHQRRQLVQIPAASPPDDAAWIDAIPHLDAALDQLPDPDRHVLLLHFFENRSFPGIARSLG